MTWLRRFGAFLYDFLVGDAWELFIGPIVVLVVGWALVQAGLGSAVIGLLVVGGVVLVAAINVVAGLRASG